MTQLNGMILCGKRGGKSFINQTRVRPYKRTCANGLLPCSFHTSQTDTICVAPERKAEDCPILDIAFITKEKSSTTRAEASRYSDSTGLRRKVKGWSTTNL